MQDIERQVLDLQTAMDDTLWDLLEDFKAPDPARAAADKILKERLNLTLKDAIGDFQSATLKFLNLIEHLEAAVRSIGSRAPTESMAKVAPLLERAREVQRIYHDTEGMRTTHTTQDEVDDVQSDEDAEPPSKAPKRLSAAEMDVPRLFSPRPRSSRKYNELADEYVQFFAGADFVSREKEKAADEYARKLESYRAHYEGTVKSSGVPWWFVGLTHMMESSFNFNTHLHNGDPLSSRTFRVPSGLPKRGSPPFKWDVSARDALERQGLLGQSDWSLPRALYRLEQYNGFGYRKRGIPTPYLWSFSTIYDKGKFVADGVFNSDAVSRQCGAATVLKVLHQKDVVDLDLDYVGEDETRNESAYKTDAEKAAASGSNIVDDELPVNADFHRFLMNELPNLKHFQPREFLVKGGSNAKNGLNTAPPPALWPNIVKLAEVLMELRERLNHPIVLNSVYRSEDYNKSIGGASGSQHKKFCAADFRVIGAGTPPEWAGALRRLRDANVFKGGIGIYKTFVHVDTRGWPANW